MTTSIISKLAPKNSGAFPTHSDVHTEGGFQVRADTTDRDSIPTLNRKEGMWVKVQSDGKIYTLSGGITNGDWVEVSFSAGAAVLFDSGAPENIKTGRVTNPSPIDNTKSGIVNLSSDTSGASPGATGNYTTISGGDVNQAVVDYATVSGGRNNSAQGIDSTVGGGNGNGANSDNSTVSGGLGNSANALSSTVCGGETNVVNGSYGIIVGGTGNIINGQYAIVTHGSNNAADGNYSRAGGETSITNGGVV
jgi:hypothetical protein